MPLPIRLVVKQTETVGAEEDPTRILYFVAEVHNSLDWRVGQRLSRYEIASLIDAGNVEVVIR